MHRHHGANKCRRAPGICSNACRPWMEQTLPRSCNGVCRAVAASFPSIRGLLELRAWVRRRRISGSYLPKQAYRQMSVRDDLLAGGRRRGGLRGDQSFSEDDLLAGGRRRVSWRGHPKQAYRQMSVRDDPLAGGRRRVSWRGHPKLVYRQMSVQDDLPAGGRRRGGLRGDRVMTALPRRVG